MKAVVVNRLARPELCDIPLLIDSELPDPEFKSHDLLSALKPLLSTPSI